MQQHVAIEQDYNQSKTELRTIYTKKDLQELTLALESGTAQNIINFFSNVLSPHATEQGLKNTLLHEAARDQEYGPQLAGVLIDYYDVNVDMQNLSGQTPLFTAIDRNNYTVAQQLLVAGANPEIKNFLGVTPLFHAILKADEELITLLLQHGADANCVCTTTQLTPLHNAVQKGSVFATQLLLDHDANIDAQDAHGNTPLHYAVDQKFNDLITLLLENNANTFATNNGGLSPIEMMLGYDADRYKSLILPQTSRPANTTRKDPSKALQKCNNYSNT
ncbi:MAG: ankyrin repeat domain-containing protein [Epsilonproteobacteria bacterium]|nr:ankyrin repeat domain-containing protein [Campylobacterota bacterium]